MSLRTWNAPVLPKVDQKRARFVLTKIDGQLVADTIARIESAQFLPHSGIRFPQNPCSSCPYVGLCLRDSGLGTAERGGAGTPGSWSWADTRGRAAISSVRPS